MLAKEEFQGFISPRIPVLLINTGENKYKLQFSWGVTRQITLAVPKSGEILCDFLQKMWEYSEDFDKETEFFFKRDAEGKGFVFSFLMNNSGETIVRLTYNQLIDGKPIKGGVTRQNTDLYKLYLRIITEKNIKIPKTPSPSKVFNDYYNGDGNFMTPEVMGYEEKTFNGETLLIEKSTGDFLEHTLYGCSVLIKDREGFVQKIELSKCLFSQKELDKYVKSITPKMVKKARRYGEKKQI